MLALITLLSLAAAEVTLRSSNDSSLVDLHLLGLVPISGEQYSFGGAQLPVYQMAAKDFTNAGLLKGYRLILHMEDSKCSRGPGINSAFRQLYGPHPMVMSLGPSCSPVAEPLCEALVNWNITFVSPLAASDGFADREKYPRLFRLLSSDVSQVPVRMQIIKEFHWTKVALIAQNYELFTGVAEQTDQVANELGWEVLAYEIFSSDIDKSIAKLRAADARIIFAGFYPPSGVQVLCSAYKHNFFGKEILWILNTWIEFDWVSKYSAHTSCTEDEIYRVLDNSLYVGQMTSNQVKEVDVYGRTLASLDEEFFAYFNNTSPEGASYRTSTYDSFWVAALALNCTQNKLIQKGSSKRLENFTHADIEMADMITDCVRNTSFVGLSGDIEFTGSGSPDPNIIIQQQRGENRFDIGYFLKETKELVWLTGGAVWPDGKPPADSSELLMRRIYISRHLYVTMCVLGAFGILQALALLAFNIMNRANRLIKMSSPNINNLILIGSIVTYTTVFFADIDGFLIPVSSICTIRLCTFNIGFSTAFGALFAKTWRIHAILTSTKRRKQHMMRDSTLMLFVFILLLLVSSIILTWLTTDFFTISRTNITLPTTSIQDDVIVIEELVHCKSRNNLYFMGALYGLQGLMMIFGAFLAWETRKVKLDALNDSKQIAISIYNVVLLSLLGAVISLVVDDDVNVSYGAISTLQLLGTLITINTIFLPKVAAFRKGEMALGPVLHASTLHENSSRMASAIDPPAKQSDKSSSTKVGTITK